MYKSRRWLNAAESPSTGTVVAYEGVSDWSEKTVSFFEISDCHGKIRLHKTENDTDEEFVRKLRTLAEEANKFADYLEIF